MPRKWLDKEIQTIKDNVNKLSDTEIGKLIGRDGSSVARFRSRKGIIRDDWFGKFLRGNGGKHAQKDQSGNKNPNWKGGIGKDGYRYSLIRIKRYPEKHKAGYLARYALKIGKIIKKPCETCACTNTEMHHDDYSKPLEVRFLCRKHHRELERNNNEQKN